MPDESLVLLQHVFTPGPALDRAPLLRQTVGVFASFAMVTTWLEQCRHQNAMPPLDLPEGAFHAYEARATAASGPVLWRAGQMFAAKGRPTATASFRPGDFVGVLLCDVFRHGVFHRAWSMSTVVLLEFPRVHVPPHCIVRLPMALPEAERAALLAQAKEWP